MNFEVYCTISENILKFQLILYNSTIKANKLIKN
jgi:hypothetical protein